MGNSLVINEWMSSYPGVSLFSELWGLGNDEGVNEWKGRKWISGWIYCLMNGGMMGMMILYRNK